jgi:uncharacterized protein
MNDLWPWWLGALALAGTALSYLLVIGRPLGVSGAVGVVLDGDALRAGGAPALDEAALEAELLAATREAFGDDALLQLSSAGPAALPSTMPAGKPLLWTDSAAFLVAVIAGGLVATATRGTFTVATALPASVTSLFGQGGWAALFVGGLLVGVGTQMAGGCTSGHGLVGCARLQPASLVATMTFLGTAIAASLVMQQVLR